MQVKLVPELSRKMVRNLTGHNIGRGNNLNRTAKGNNVNTDTKLKRAQGMFQEEAEVRIN